MAAEEDLLHLHLPYQVREDPVDTHHQDRGRQDMVAEVDLHHHHLPHQALREALMPMADVQLATRQSLL